LNEEHLTADICDEIGEHTTILPLIFSGYGGRKIFEGEIVTLKTANDNTLVRAILSEKGEGKVLLIDGGGSTDCALLGGNLALLGKENQWAGAIVYGCVRDVLELEGIDFGVKAIGTNPKKSMKSGRGEKNVSVTIQGVKVHPGEYLYSDHDGTIVISNPWDSNLGINSGD